MKSNKKTISSYIISFFATILVALILLVIGTLAGLLNAKSIQRELIQTEYYNNLIADIQMNIENVLLTAGLEKEIIGNLEADEEFQKQAKAYVEETLVGNEYEINIDDMLAQTKDNLIEYLSRKDIVIDEQVEKAVDVMIGEIEKLCLDAIRNPLFHYLYDYAIKYKPIWYGVLAVLIGILCVLQVWLVRRHRMPHRGWNYIAYAWLSGSLMAMIVPIYGLVSKAYARINISPEYFHTFFSEYLKTSLYDYFIVELAGLVIYGAIMVLVVLSRNQQKIQIQTIEGMIK